MSSKTAADPDLRASFLAVQLDCIKARFPGLMSNPEDAAAVKQIIEEVSDTAERYVRVKSQTEMMLQMARFLEVDLSLFRNDKSPLPPQFTEILHADPRGALIEFMQLTYTMLNDALATIAAGGSIPSSPPPAPPHEEQKAVANDEDLEQHLKMVENEVEKIVSEQAVLVPWTLRERGQA